MAGTIILLALLSFCSFSRSQSIYINQVPQYDDLDSCAEPPLSTVIRDMESGCGDGGRLTSYSCFCTASSSRFASIISTAVLKVCPGSTDDANSATQVFSAYCQLGASLTTATSTTAASTTFSSTTSTLPISSATLSTTSTSTSSTTSSPTSLQATPQATSAEASSSTLQTPTQIVTTSGSPSSSVAVSSTSTSALDSGASLNKITLVAIIVVIVLLVFCISAVGVWWYRKRQASRKPPPYEPSEIRGVSTSVSDDRKDLIELGDAPEMLNEMGGAWQVGKDASGGSSTEAAELAQSTRRAELPVSTQHVGFMVKGTQGHTRLKSRTVRYSTQELQ